MKVALANEEHNCCVLMEQIRKSNEKYAELDEKYRKMAKENNNLKAKIQTRDEDEDEKSINEPRINPSNEKLQRKNNEIEEELAGLTFKYNAANDEIGKLEKELDQSKKSMTTELEAKSRALSKSNAEADRLKKDLADCKLQLANVEKKYGEHFEALKAIKPQLEESNLDESALYEILNSTDQPLNTSSFCGPAETMADIQLNDLQRKVDELQCGVIALFKVTTEASDENGVDPPSFDEIFAILHSKYSNFSKENAELQTKIAQKTTELSQLEESEKDFPISTLAELNVLKTAQSSWQGTINA